LPPPIHSVTRPEFVVLAFHLGEDLGYADGAGGADRVAGKGPVGGAYDVLRNGTAE